MTTSFQEQARVVQLALSSGVIDRRKTRLFCWWIGMSWIIGWGCCQPIGLEFFMR